MKKRTVVAATVIVAVLALAVAKAQSVAPALNPPPTDLSGVQLAPEQTRLPSTSALAPALEAGRFTFNLIGFGRVGYYADTTASGRPLLLVVSVNAAASAYEMKPLFDAYRGKRPVYVLEWPGFGGSDRLNVVYTPQLMASAFSRMLDIIGGETDVVALSLGSEFAARVALTEPRVRSLALISPTGLSEAKTPAELAAEPQKSQRLYGTLSSPVVSWAVFGLLSTPQVIDLFLRRSFEGPVDPGLLAYSSQSVVQPGAVYAPLYFISGLLRTPDAYSDLYTRLTQPTLVLYDRDGYVNFTRLPELLQANPNVKAVKIAPTKGLPQFEQLGQVTAALDAFWK